MSKDNHAKCACGCCGCFTAFACLALVASILGMYLKGKHNEALLETHAIYDRGGHEEAVARYKTLYQNSSPDQKSVILPRIVKYETSKKNQPEMRAWIQRGLRDKVSATYEDAEAQELLAALQKELAEKAERERLERERVEAERRQERERWAQAQAEREAKRNKVGDLHEARLEAERLVRGLLQFPEEASISLKDSTDPVEQETGGRWILKGEIVGKNAFGVKSRYTWVVQIQCRQNERERWWENIETVLLNGSEVVARSGGKRRSN